MAAERDDITRPRDGETAGLAVGHRLPRALVPENDDPRLDEGKASQIFPAICDTDYPRSGQ
jgi:hypothetical protein